MRISKKHIIYLFSMHMGLNGHLFLDERKIRKLILRVSHKIRSTLFLLQNEFRHSFKTTQKHK